jgi:protein-disulfide isomerase
MPKRSKKIIAVIIFIVCIAIVYGIKAVIGPSVMGFSTQANSKIKGHKDAPVKITEFVDFQCPACAMGAKYLEEQIQSHPEFILLQIKHYPLEMHLHGLLSAQYAECANQQGKFWPFHDLLFSRQGNWTRLVNATQAFDQMAHEVGLNMEDLNACLKDEKVTEIIARNKTEGAARGVRSTPSYFVNGKLVVGKQSLEAEIKKYLEKN